MKKYFLRISGLAAIILLLHAPGFAQDDKDSKTKDKIKTENGDEIIIKRKGDKDSKITVEIKDGNLLINGKPADEFEDDNLSIIRRKDGDGDVFAFAPRSPFRGGYSWNGDELVDSKTAFLGVSSEKSDNGGVEVREVTKGSAAEKIGLKKGDIITKIDDAQIDDPEDLTKAVRSHKPDDKIVITYKRDGKVQTSTATLGKMQMNMAYNFKMPNMNENFDLVVPPPGAPYPRPYAFSWNSSGPKIGIKAQDTENGKGVKVLDVDDESPAEKAGIKEGDIITQFDGKEVNGAGQLAELARAAKTKPSVKVKLNRGGKLQDVEVKIPRKLKTADL
ncbi:MAG TPA: PDZ domain-containing protein [Puia sp.]|nr:PDZ domain-containing protein [Puia sp.]